MSASVARVLAARLVSHLCENERARCVGDRETNLTVQKLPSHKFQFDRGNPTADTILLAVKFNNRSWAAGLGNSERFP